MNRTTTFAMRLCSALPPSALPGTQPQRRRTSPEQARAETISMLGTTPSRHLFITPSGQTFAVPTGPLTPGTRVLGFEVGSYKTGRLLGSDLEQCTMSF